MHDIKLPALLFIVITVVAITGYISISGADAAPDYSILTAPEVIITPFPTPLPINHLPALPVSVSKTEIQTQPSPDGTKKLVMSVKQDPSGIMEYIFTTMDADGNNIRDVYIHKPTVGGYSIPFNTWSPDDKYFFIEKNTGEALVFTRTGEKITGEEQFINVKEVFADKGLSDTYKLVTGWASPTLLIINTVTSGGGKGSSYWFEVPSKAVTRLWGDF